MEKFVSTLALFVGISAVIIPTVTAFVNVKRLYQTTGDLLILTIGAEEFVIDVGSIDKTDVDVIDAATRAVYEQQKMNV